MLDGSPHYFHSTNREIDFHRFFTSVRITSVMSVWKNKYPRGDRCPRSITAESNSRRFINRAIYYLRADGRFTFAQASLTRDFYPLIDTAARTSRFPIAGKVLRLIITDCCSLPRTELRIFLASKSEPTTLNNWKATRGKPVLKLLFH